MEMITSRTNADLQRSKTNMNQSTVYLDNLNSNYNGIIPIKFSTPIKYSPLQILHSYKIQFFNQVLSS